MPAIIANINEKVNTERQVNIALKVTKAMERMRAAGELNQTYDSTESFVDALSKYLKIIQRCNSSNIDKCWPTDVVIDGSGQEFQVKKAKTGKNLSLRTTTNNVGLILADGASIILNYNNGAVGMDIGDPVTTIYKNLPSGNGDKRYAYTSTVTSSIDFVMDVNGGKGPNREKFGDKEYDIRSFMGAKFKGGCDGTKIEGVGCPKYVANGGYQTALDTCEGLDMRLPTKSELQSICYVRASYPELAPHEDFYWYDVGGASTKRGVSFINCGTRSWPSNWDNGITCIGD